MFLFYFSFINVQYTVISQWICLSVNRFFTLCSHFIIGSNKFIKKLVILVLLIVQILIFILQFWKVMINGENKPQETGIFKSSLISRVLNRKKNAMINVLCSISELRVSKKCIEIHEILHGNVWIRDLNPIVDFKLIELRLYL